MTLSEPATVVRTDPGRGVTIRTPLHRTARTALLCLLTTLLTALTVATSPAAVAAPEILAQGFTVYNLTSHPMRFTGVGGANTDRIGGPPVGSVLPPGGSHGFQVTYLFAQNSEAEANYTGDAGTYTAKFDVDDVNQPLTACEEEDCTPGRGWVPGHIVSFLDSPGTTFTIPAGQNQSQADLLNELCQDGYPAQCDFVATSDAEILAPAALAASPVVNESGETLTYSIGTSLTVTNTDRVNVSVKARTTLTLLAQKINLEISASYGHTWTNSKKFTQTINVTVPPHCSSTITFGAPIFRTTGNLTVTMGNTTWNLPGVAFDTPNDNSVGKYHISDDNLIPNSPRTDCSRNDTPIEPAV